MLKQHTHYVYYDGPDVFARRGTDAPVLAETCESPQAAHDKVQSIVNPDGLHHHSVQLSHVDPKLCGFHHPDFQGAISDNCREYVEAAYAKASGG